VKRLVALALLVTALPAAADSYPPAHSCTMPRQDVFGKWELPYGTTLESALDDYRDCLQRFARMQKHASKVHLDAADAAIAEWNALVECLNRNHRLGFDQRC
jgi:hypothetical protein